MAGERLVPGATGELMVELVGSTGWFHDAICWLMMLVVDDACMMNGGL